MRRASPTPRRFRRHEQPRRPARPGDVPVDRGTDEFRFILLPPVLGELDKLKIAHKNPDVREGATRAITRIKGWRDQARRAVGTLNDGTVVDGTITVQSLHVEPDVNGSLSWLDASVADDRISAAVRRPSLP